MRVTYADPPYPGQAAKHYGRHVDYAGEVDHTELITRMEANYDGWLLHTSSTALRDVLPLCPPSVRVMAWVKPFCAFKANVAPAYAWEPVIVKAARKAKVTHRLVMRDWITESMTLRRGLVGAKPQAVCFWAFEVLGTEPDDGLDDLFPGTGGVTRALELFKETQ